MAEWYARLGKGLYRVGQDAAAGFGVGAGVGGVATAPAGGVGAIPGGIIGAVGGGLLGIGHAIMADGEEEQADAAQAQQKGLADAYAAMRNPYDYNGAEAQGLMRANHAQAAQMYGRGLADQTGALAASGMLGGGYQRAGLEAAQSGLNRAIYQGDMATRQDFFNKAQDWENTRRAGLMGYAHDQEATHFARGADVDRAAGQTLTGAASIASSFLGPGGLLGQGYQGGLTPSAPKFTAQKTLATGPRAPRAGRMGMMTPDLGNPMGGGFDTEIPGYPKRRPGLGGY